MSVRRIRTAVEVGSPQYGIRAGAETVAHPLSHDDLGALRIEPPIHRAPVHRVHQIGPLQTVQIDELLFPDMRVQRDVPPARVTRLSCQARMAGI